MSKIIIEFDDEHDKEITIEYVQKLVSEGYTSGYYPHWHIEEEEA